MSKATLTANKNVLGVSRESEDGGSGVRAGRCAQALLALGTLWACCLEPWPPERALC